LGPSFWKDKKVFLTGHTGFKGGWLGVWLESLGARVFGFALPPDTEPSLFELCGHGVASSSVFGDVRDLPLLRSSLIDADPDIVFHMAAQPLVRLSYRAPVQTYEVNVMGTVHLLEAIRELAQAKPSRSRAVVIVTTDKCYENREWYWGYRENDRLGGYDPYSNSKACAELVASCYRDSFFPPARYSEHRVAVASARAGNVIGGGDWSIDRLVPDLIKARSSQGKMRIRNPSSIRPWQHVLEPLSGYMALAEKLLTEGSRFSGGWNFGPEESSSKSVEWVVRKLEEMEGNPIGIDAASSGDAPHEARFLKLDCSKARQELGWTSRWNVLEALSRVLDWIRAYESGADMHAFCLSQIRDYEAASVH